MFKILRTLFIVVLFVIAAIVLTQPTETSDGACDAVRYLMSRDLTPYDFSSEGGVLLPGEAQSATFEADEYSHYYPLNVDDSAPLEIQFTDVDSSLEFAVFRGMEQIAAYQPLAALSLTLEESGIYTIVVRRSRIQDVETTGSYTLRATYTSAGDVALQNLRDEWIGQLLAMPPELVGGQQQVILPSAAVRVHVGALSAVASRNGESAQLVFGNNGILIGQWANQIALLGGDLAVRGENRLLYVQDYGYEVRNIDPNLNRLETSNGTQVNTDWQIVKGIWLTTTCVGMKLTDGRTFTTPVIPDQRTITFNGNLDNFSINTVSPVINMNWHGVLENSEARFENGVFQVNFIGDRRLSLEASRINMFRLMEGELTPNTPLDVSLPDQAVNLTLDWINLGAFSLNNTIMRFDFTDAPRGTVERSSVNLRLVEALNDVIVIEYHGEPGEQRLLLPGSDSYLELVTPAGFPAFNSLALPNEAGFAPRALNNLGGECYPVNTLLEEANCPPNGHPNPANGNLWYAVTDLLAHGYRLDLALTRSYNSLAAQIEGGFGFGWSTTYQLDYNVAFDPLTGSRLITPETPYRTSLDVNWSPRGIVTFTTASGSRHVFVSPENQFDGGQLTAITMPGWVLSRQNRRSGWLLRQPDGMSYEFDRAGRLLRYGYPDSSRMIEIQYDRTSLTGPAGQTAIISDDITQRKLELYFDDQHHISRSVLRDMTKTGDGCEFEQNCFETVYTYTGSMLTSVIYSDGQTATYNYDDRRNLIEHRDPRAPIAPDMNYTYSASGVETVTILDTQPLIWRTLAPPVINGNSRSITVTNERGVAQSYTYNLAGDTSLRVAGNGYTLASVTSPVAAAASVDAQPTAYTWTNGLLTQINAKGIENSGGRNSTRFEYTPAGQVRFVGGGYLDTSIEFGDNGLPEFVQFADNTRLTYTYNERRLPQTVTDRQGAVYLLEWNERGWLSSMTRQNDGITWAYQYNSFGLVTSLTRNGYTTGYTWDALGRLTTVNDPLLGLYTITYGQPEDDFSSQITITDAVGVEEITRFDRLGRVIETRLSTASNPNLRRATSTYDVLNRLTTQTAWLDSEPLTTTYGYGSVPLLGTEPINGYVVVITDPYGRTAFYYYDALDRIRWIQDPLQGVTSYEYSYTDTKQTNGLRIIQRNIRGQNIVATTVYQFDAHWQLREVGRTSGGETLNWRFFTEGDPVKVRYMEAPESDIRTLTWERDNFGRITGVQVNPVAVELVSQTPQPGANLRVEYDFLGRVISTTEATGRVTRTFYCPLENGAQKVVQGAADCADTNYTQATWYDAHDRVTRVEDAHGTQTYTYQRDADTWRVDVDFGGVYTWTLRYDPAGDLVLWIDDSGITHTYLHDTIGRLRQVMVENQPEASFTFAYNALGQVTRIVDGLERGTLYQYDENGLLIVEQDILTADATTYAYGPYGEMTSLISPLGNTLSFFYDDPGDPTRLTGIIDPTGVIQQFAWDDTTNTLSFTDAQGHVTRYQFDGFGALRRMDDAAGRSHELHYDAAGYLRQWASVQTAQDAARAFVLSALQNGEMTISEVDQPEWVWQLGFNASGDLAHLTDPSGDNVSLGYDSLGRLNLVDVGQYRWTMEREPGAQTLALNGTPLTFDSLYRLLESGATRYDYTPGERGNFELTLQRDGERTYQFSPGDDSSRPRTVTLSAPGQTMTYIYNPEGLLDEIRLSTCTLETCEGDQGVWTTSTRFFYDALGRPTRIIDEAQNIETFSYDEIGNLISYQNFNGKTFTYQYDTLNRLTGITGPTGLKLLLAYDDLAHVTGICRTRAEAPDDYTGCVAIGGLLESYTYDSLGRLTAQTFPNVAATNGQTTLTHTYENGRLTSWGLADGERVRLGYGILGLLDALISGTAYDLVYDEALQLSRINNTRYTYDEYGRIIQKTEGNFTFDFAYMPDHAGYTVTQGETALSFALSEGGWLAALDYGLNNDIPLISLQYRLNQPEILTVLTNSRDESLTFDFQLDPLEQVQNLVFNYATSRLLTDYLVNPAGRITRQRIDAIPADFFAAEAAGYITVTGYDEEDRISTVRVTDKGDGRLLYALNFTYNNFGLRETETHRYVDGSQMNIRYEYASPNQLIGRNVSMIRPKQPVETYSYSYQYDTTGNLASINTNGATCADYRYDSANRLIQVNQNGQQFNYGYDAHNRLVSLNNWTIVYAGDAPLMAYNRDGVTAYYGQLENQPPLFIAEGEQIRWLVPDGRDQFMTVAQDGTVAPLTLLDPRGRALTLTPPEGDGCSLALPSTSLPQVSFAGMLWDPVTNLYFKDGRAYQPDIARFLQRDPQGPNSFGLVYDLSLRQPVPVQHRRPFEIGYGLQTLKQAVDITRQTDSLNVDGVKAQFYPSLPDWSESFGKPDQSLAQLERFMRLPEWLQTSYNQPDGEIDGLSGTLRLNRLGAPGNLFQSGKSLSPLVQTPIDVVRDALEMPQIFIQPAASYEAFEWMPDATGLDDVFNNVEQFITPDAVIDWLPQPLTAPENSVRTLELLQRLEALPQMTARTWIDNLLQRALPILPELPPESVEAWRSHWFSDDTFGIGRILERRHPVPETPYVPQYDIGINMEWLYLR